MEEIDTHTHTHTHRMQRIYKGTPQHEPSRVNSLHRFGTRFYKNTQERMHLHIYILRFLLLLSTCENKVKIKN